MRNSSGRNQVRKNEEFISVKFDKIRALEPYNAMRTKAHLNSNVDF